MPLVLTEAGQGSGFAHAVTPTTPRWGLHRCAGAQHHAAKPRRRCLQWGLRPRVGGMLFAAPAILQLGGAFGVKRGCGGGATRVMRSGRATRDHGPWRHAVAEVFSRRILRQVPSSSTSATVTVRVYDSDTRHPVRGTHRCLASPSFCGCGGRAQPADEVSGEGPTGCRRQQIFAAKSRAPAHGSRPHQRCRRRDLAAPEEHYEDDFAAHTQRTTRSTASAGPDGRWHSNDDEERGGVCATRPAPAEPTLSQALRDTPGRQGRQAPIGEPSKRGFTGGDCPWSQCHGRTERDGPETARRTHHHPAAKQGNVWGCGRPQGRVVNHV